MKKAISLAACTMIILISTAQTQKKNTKPEVKYDTFIVKRVPKPVPKPVVNAEPVMPTPEYINQPYYYDKGDNRLTKLESISAQLVTKKKSLGLKGAKQFFSMNDPSSPVRFTARNNISFMIKSSGDVIDFTSYIKLYKFVSADQKREVTITSKEGMLNDKEESKGKLISFSIKMISKDNYMIQFSDALEAGEYGFVWVKNMESERVQCICFRNRLEKQRLNWQKQLL